MGGTPWIRCLTLRLTVWRFSKTILASPARAGIAWVLLPREDPSTLILCQTCRVFSDVPLHYPCGHRLSAIFHSCHAEHIDRENPNLAPFAGSFYSLTRGVNYYPHPNVTIRPEIRYDWFTGGRNPYNDGQKDNQVLVAINVYLQF